MKQQVFVIHGGDAFDTYEEYLASLREKEVSIERTHFVDWKRNLEERLGDAYEVILPRMPNAQNARYAEWKIIFEKYVALLGEQVILIGHSLGGIFLAKYLSEETYPKTIKAVFLVAAPYNTADHNPYADFNLPQDLSGLQEQGGKVFLYHSKDDFVVPFEDLAQYEMRLPHATARIFSDRQHFNQEDLPEIVTDIQGLS